MAIIWTNDDNGANSTHYGKGSNGGAYVITKGAGGWRTVNVDGTDAPKRMRYSDALAYCENHDATRSIPAPVPCDDDAPLPCDPIPSILIGEPTVIIPSPVRDAFVANVADAPALPDAPASADSVIAPIGADGSSNASADRASAPVMGGSFALAGGAPRSPNGQGISMLGNAGRYLALRMNAEEKARRALLADGRMLRYTVSGYILPSALPGRFSAPFALPAYLADFAFRTGAIDDDGAEACAAALAEGKDIGAAVSKAIRAMFDRLADTHGDDERAYHAESGRMVADYVARVIDKGYKSAEGERVASLASTERREALASMARRTAKTDDATHATASDREQAEEKASSLNDKDIEAALRATRSMRDTLREALERLTLPVYVSKRDVARTVKASKAAALAKARPAFDAKMIALTARVSAALAFAPIREAFDGALATAGEKAIPIVKDRMASEALALLAGKLAKTEGAAALAARCKDGAEALAARADAQDAWRAASKATTVEVKMIAGRAVFLPPV